MRFVKVKMKKQKQVFNKGNKIRDIVIDSKSHLAILASLLVIFNAFLIVCAILLASMLNVWYVWLIDFLLVLFCVVKSILTYVKGSKYFCYSLYENCIYLDSIWYDKTIIEYKLINRIKFKTGLLDNFFGKKTHTLTLFLDDELQTKVNLYLIKEKPENLIEEIAKHSQLIFKAKHQSSANKESTLTQTNKTTAKVGQTTKPLNSKNVVSAKSSQKEKNQKDSKNKISNKKK